MGWVGRTAVVAGLGGAVTAGCLGLVTGALAPDVGVGRRTRPLGPQVVDIAAPREVVFDVIAQPYLGRSTRAMREKARVLERGDDMVLAEHFTPVAGGRLTAKTTETVRFTRPGRIDFRLVRGPVPAVIESFRLTEHASGSRLEYEGGLGTDGWALGERWGRLVAARWEETVAASLSAVKKEAERRSALP
ncbi:SRPBCC family protein [Streptomyces sp. bgisy060]|uniref:SRPBCC family protein n=1 Tax=Streptomyces sp. bgisy060 TaxID=3413775 RepID=UPI003EBFC62B